MMVAYADQPLYRGFERTLATLRNDTENGLEMKPTILENTELRV